MPCEWFEKDGVVIHIRRSRGRDRLMKCKFCQYNYRESEGKLCDFPVAEGKTCDAAMCKDCARTLGGQKTDVGFGMKKLGDSIDVCPIHRDKAAVVDGKLVVREG